jgi:uncharacterized protein
VSLWDASAIVPLILPESQSLAVQERLGRDGQVAVWWGTPVECQSAVERKRRTGELSEAAAGAAARKLDRLRLAWQEVEPTEAIRERALKYLRIHPLRAADALQLAAAFAAAEEQPPTLEFLSLDKRLVEAARREGFRIVEARS